MGKWLPGRVQRIGRDGEVDLILDDGTELENVPEERLRMPKQQAMQRASSWDCLEALAKDNHLRRGKVGKEPKQTTTMKKDEVRGIEELLGQELVKGLRDAFGDADSMKEGELDVDDVLTAFTSLRRVASRKDILAWLRTRSSRVRTRRTLSFVEFRYDINLWSRLSQAVFHLVTILANEFTDQRISGLLLLARYNALRTILAATSATSPLDWKSSLENKWSSMHGVANDFKDSMLLPVSSRYRPTHCSACPVMEYSHALISALPLFLGLFLLSTSPKEDSGASCALKAGRGGSTPRKLGVSV